MAGVTIEELGLRFVRSVWKITGVAVCCLYFFWQVYSGIFFTAGEKNPECSCII